MVRHAKELRSAGYDGLVASVVEFVNPQNG